MKKKIYSFVIFLLASLSVIAQTETLSRPDTTEPKGHDSTKVASNVQAETLPELEGGFHRHLAMSLRYPVLEKEKGIQGTVYVGFFIETDGAVTNVIVKKGVPNGPGLDAEAVRVVKAMPKWKPGMINGEAVRVEMTLPVKFVLQ